VATRQTDPAETTPAAAKPVSAGTGKLAGSVITVWLSFLVFSFWQAPIPAVNEPHWLAKAKHYWQPDWCAGDFFLTSSNTHLVFYQTVGALTTVFSFELTALIGRVLGYLLLAFGWVSLCRSATGKRETALPAAWLFLLLASIGNLSGEWLVSGIEGKVFSYAFMFLSLARLGESDWLRSGLYGGLGIAFHPLVGIWFAIAAGMAIAMAAVVPGRGRLNLNDLSGTMRQPLAIAGLIILIGVSLFGVVPALQAIGGTSPQVTFTATYLQVFYRLGHHLDPMEFDGWRYAMYLLMALAVWLLIHTGEHRGQITWLGRAALASGIIAAVGWLVGLRDSSIVDVELPKRMPLYELRATLLKFYPFRLVDVFLPVVLAVLLARHAVTRLFHFYPATLKAGFVVAVAATLWLSAGRGSDNRMEAQQEANWLQACEWIRRNTPKDAVVHTPHQTWAFKWFGHRAEYVAVKDCPQDAAGIVEWNDRQLGFGAWASDPDIYADRLYSRAETEELSRKKGITHLLIHRRKKTGKKTLGPFEVESLFTNSTYHVYRISPESDSPHD